jgi:hypothetical protein
MLLISYRVIFCNVDERDSSLSMTGAFLENTNSGRTFRQGADSDNDEYGGHSFDFIM